MAGAVQVNDVCVLVREDHAEPVVGLADNLGARRRSRVQKDGVAWQRRCPAVGTLRLVGQNDVRVQRRRHAHRGANPRPDVFRKRGKTLRECVFILMEIDREMRGS